jgi:transposase
VPRKRKKPVRSTEEERERLEGLIACGNNAPARQLAHARILLRTDEGASPDAPGRAWPDTRIADALEISRSTVRRARERFVAEGPGAALVHRKPVRTKPKKLDGSQEARLIALACSEPPEGRGRWSVRLLAERFARLECADEPVSREPVRRTLRKAR